MSLNGDDCSDVIGSFYDPTHQCMDFSGSEFCNGSLLCGDNDYSYDCDFENDRYSCAPGDFSGKMGTITDLTTPFWYNSNGTDLLLPPLASMDGMVFAVYCGDNDSGFKPLACAPLFDTSMSMNMTNASFTSTTTTTSSPWSGNTMVATFSGDNDLTGTVTVDNGYVIIDLDGSLMPDINGANWSTCVDGGMKYHIHMLWEHSDDTDKLNGTMCGAGYTGGHWDPWQGCGSATGNSYCSAKGGCVDDTYSASFSSDVFSAEVGDWNGKYGLLEFSDSGYASANVSSFFEVTPADVMGMSVVFHCNDGSRAFCAPFVDSGEAPAYSIPAQDVSNSSVMAELADGTVYMSSDGEITTDHESIDLSGDAGDCDELYYGIFEAGDATLDGYATGEDCESYVGDFWDPTHQCPDFSGSEFCTDGLLCDDADYSYDCDYENDRYSCAPGDFSGKFGSITDASDFEIDEHGPDTLIPTTDDMLGMMFVVYCGDNTEGITYVTCATIEKTPTTTENPDGDGVVAKTVGVTLVATLIAMLF